MECAVIFDCEWLTAEGAPRRFWCGPFDPDPIIVQIGATKLALNPDFAITNELKLYVTPKDRGGRPYALDPFFTRLTGITETTVQEQGRPLTQALNELARFSDGCRLWSWGKDEFHMMAISAYVAGVAPPIPATRFSNAAALMLRAGVPHEDLQRTPSHRLAAYFGVTDESFQAHDALDDARSVTYAIQHLLRSGRLTQRDLREAPPSSHASSGPE